MIDLFLSRIQILCFKLNGEKQYALEICLRESVKAKMEVLFKKLESSDQMLHFCLWPELSGILHYSSAYQNKGLHWTKDRGLFCLGSVGDWPAGQCALVWECLSLSHHSMCVHCCMCGIPSLNLQETSKTHPSTTILHNFCYSNAVCLWTRLCTKCQNLI